MSARYVCAGVLLLSAATTLASAAGRVVVGHDANTLSTSLAGPTEAHLAVNIANWLIASQPGPITVPSILLVQSSTVDARHDISSSVAQALSTAGYSVTTTSAHNQTFAELSQFNAVFTSFDFDHNYAFQNTSDLTTYVQQGGGVYVWAGMGLVTNTEVATLNPFLANVGLRFDTNLGQGLGGGNGIYGHTVQSTHPIFAGITDGWLRSQNGGTSIMTTGEHPNAQVIETHSGIGIFAVSEGVIPTPGTALLAITGAAMIAPRRRRK